MMLYSVQCMQCSCNMFSVLMLVVGTWISTRTISWWHWWDNGIRPQLQPGLKPQTLKFEPPWVNELSVVSYSFTGHDNWQYISLLVTNSYASPMYRLFTYPENSALVQCTHPACLRRWLYCTEGRVTALFTSSGLIKVWLWLPCL